MPINWHFWDIAHRRVVIPYRRFDTTPRSHRQGSRSLDFLSLENEAYGLSRNVDTLGCLMYQNSADLTCIASEAWNHARRFFVHISEPTEMRLRACYVLYVVVNIYLPSIQLSKIFTETELLAECSVNEIYFGASELRCSAFGRVGSAWCSVTVKRCVYRWRCSTLWQKCSNFRCVAAFSRSRNRRYVTHCAWFVSDQLMIVTLDGSCSCEAVKRCRCVYCAKLIVITLDGSCSCDAVTRCRCVCIVISLW